MQHFLMLLRLSDVPAGRVPNGCIQGSQTSVRETDVPVPSVPNLLGSVKLAQLLGHQPLLDRYLGPVDLKARRVGQTAGRLCFLGWEEQPDYSTLKASLIPMMQFKWLLK